MYYWFLWQPVLPYEANIHLGNVSFNLVFLHFFFYFIKTAKPDYRLICKKQKIYSNIDVFECECVCFFCFSSCWISGSTEEEGRKNKVNKFKNINNLIFYFIQMWKIVEVFFVFVSTTIFFSISNLNKKN